MSLLANNSATSSRPSSSLWRWVILAALHIPLALTISKSDRLEQVGESGGIDVEHGRRLLRREPFDRGEEEGLPVQYRGASKGVWPAYDRVNTPA